MKEAIGYIFRADVSLRMEAVCSFGTTKFQRDNPEDTTENLKASLAGREFFETPDEWDRNRPHALITDRMMMIIMPLWR